MRITRRDYGQGSGPEEQKLTPDVLYMDRLIYRRLGSWTDNKVIADTAKDKGDYGRFLTDISSYYDGNVPSFALTALDATLSIFNYTNSRFPFSDYYETTHPFGELTPYDPVKNVVSGSNNVVYNGTNVIYNQG